jgi:predicted nucleic-acid-binding Zn-ribbon protein
MPAWIGLPLMMLGAAFLLFFPLGLSWYGYGGFVAAAVAFGVWEKLRPQRSSSTRLPSERSSRGVLYPTPEAEKQARKIMLGRYLPLLNELWVVPEYCPVCRSEGFRLGSPLEAQLVMQSKDLEPRYQAYVYLPARCDTCGYTVFFDADILEERSRQREVSKETPAPPEKGS